MTKKELGAAIYRLKTEILPKFIPLFTLKTNEARNCSLNDFRELTAAAYADIRAMFLEMLEEREFFQLEAIVRLIFMGYVTSNFNSVLDFDHPFITAIAYDTEEDEYRFIVASRKFINSHISYIPKSSIPIIYGETEKDLDVGDITGIKIIANPDDFLDILSSS